MNPQSKGPQPTDASREARDRPRGTHSAIDGPCKQGLCHLPLTASNAIAAREVLSFFDQSGVTPAELDAAEVKFTADGHVFVSGQRPIAWTDSGGLLRLAVYGIPTAPDWLHAAVVGDVLRWNRNLLCTSQGKELIRHLGLDERVIVGSCLGLDSDFFGPGWLVLPVQETALTGYVRRVPVRCSHSVDWIVRAAREACHAQEGRVQP